MFSVFVFNWDRLIPRDIELTELKPIKTFHYSSGKTFSSQESVRWEIQWKTMFVPAKYESQLLRVSFFLLKTLGKNFMTRFRHTEGMRFLTYPCSRPLCLITKCDRQFFTMVNYLTGTFLPIYCFNK